MTAYYNENDSFAAAWLRELMKRNLIAPGEVDERDIRQVRADDLRGFTQCHFFAGIGVWSYALRQAGWPDDQRVWTGSCPCQPFSVSGKRAGASDERHLWPIWFPLIRESRPECVFGEQVASDDGLAWLDLVSADLEGQDYTLGAVDTPACGFGAPHRRQRLYWVAESERVRLGGRRLNYHGGTEDARRDSAERSNHRQPVEARGSIEFLADATGGFPSDEGLQRSGQHGQFAQDSGTVPLADAECNGGRADLTGRRPEGREADGRDCSTLRLADSEHAGHDRARRLASLPDSDQPGERLLDGDSSAGSVADSSGRRCEQRDEGQRTVQFADQNGDLGDTESGRCGERGDASQPRHGGHDHGASITDQLGDAGESGLEGFSGDVGNGNQPGRNTENPARSIAAAGSTNGFWRDAEWLWCRDQKYRPVEAGTFPLAHGIAKRVGKLRGFGNALVAPQAQAFIEAYRGIVACHEREKL